MTAAHAGAGSRATWVALCLAVVGVLAVAAALEPAPSGHGTHTQLGLPPCGFLLLTGFRCPGCGLTTAFAHMVRLDVIDALSANPFGVILFTMTLAALPVSLIALRRRWTFDFVLQRPATGRLAAVVVLSAVLTWAVRTVSDL